MIETNERSDLLNCIYLSAEEFVVLAAASGAEKLTCFLSDPVEKITGELVLKCLFSLCRRNLISMEEAEGEEFFQAGEQLKEIFHLINHSQKKTAAFHSESGTLEFYAYEGDPCVIIEVSSNDENALRLFLMPRDALKKRLGSGDYVVRDMGEQHMMERTEKLKDPF